MGVFLLYTHYLVNPFTRGFYCNDETIRYPHKESTVSAALCYLAGTGINLILIFVIEYDIVKREHKHSVGGDASDQLFPWKTYLKRVYYRAIVWFFGAITSELLTDLAKVTCGRLRPHFLAVCKPTINAGNGSFISLGEYCTQDGSRLTYITDYICNGESRRLRDTRLSFMSGHSSYSAFSAAFAILYIQSHVDVARFGLSKHAVQVLLASAAFYTGLSRISDYKHHWQDVLVGFLQGTTVATLISIHLRPAFHKSQVELARKNPRVSDGEIGTELRSAA